MKPKAPPPLYPAAAESKISDHAHELVSALGPADALRVVKHVIKIATHRAGGFEPEESRTAHRVVSAMVAAVDSVGKLQNELGKSLRMKERVAARTAARTAKRLAVN